MKPKILMLYWSLYFSKSILASGSPNGSSPPGGYATPSTYEYNGKQDVVIAGGGGKMRTQSGDAYVTFVLPDVK